LRCGERNSHLQYVDYPLATGGTLSRKIFALYLLIVHTNTLPLLKHCFHQLPKLLPPLALSLPLCSDLEALTGADDTLTLAARCTRVFVEFQAARKSARGLIYSIKRTRGVGPKAFRPWVLLPNEKQLSQETYWGASLSICVLAFLFGARDVCDRSIFFHKSHLDLPFKA
jgi:hypothetical protein